MHWHLPIIAQWLECDVLIAKPIKTTTIRVNTFTPAVNLLIAYNTDDGFLMRLIAVGKKKAMVISLRIYAART